MSPLSDSPAVEWRMFDGLTHYEDAVQAMEQRADAIAAGKAAEAVFLMEHPPLYTAGTSAGGSAPADQRFPFYRSGRGGQLTYHGPGQRICYVMLDLHRRTPDLRAYVAALETWIVATLADFDVHGERREDRVGVWVTRPNKPLGPAGEMAEDKIAAIGIRVRRWISFHGLALNVAPDLAHYRSIVPCGIDAPHLGVTSLHDLGRAVTMAEVDNVLRREFELVFGATASAVAP